MVSIRKIFLYFMAQTILAYEAYKKFKTMMAEQQTGRKSKVLRRDYRAEYINRMFRRSLEKDGIRHQKTGPSSPEQNVVAESMNRTLIEKTRTMLNNFQLQKEFDRQKSVKVPEVKTPEEA